jgi:hypothetical protein
MLRTEEDLVLSIWSDTNVTMPSENLKVAILDYFVAVGRKMQMFSREYVMHKVSHMWTWRIYLFKI